MRFVATVTSFLLAIVFLLVGIGQRTVMLGPDSLSLTTDVPTQSAVLVVDSAITASLPDAIRLQALADGQDIIAVTGRSKDVAAWLDDQQYATITFNARTESLGTRLVSGKKFDALNPVELPNPIGSDLWLEDQTGQSSISVFGDIPEEHSVMFTTVDGTPGAFTKLKMTWQLDNATPWAGPAFLMGGIFLLLGFILALLQFIRYRRRRGPQRKLPRLTKETKAISKKQKTRAIEAAPKRGRRAKRMAVIGVTLSAGLFATGCSADYWPQFEETSDNVDGTSSEAKPKGDSGTNVPQNSVEAYIPEPSISVNQYEKVIERIAESIAEADENLDAEAAKERVGAGALEARTVAYAIKKKNDKLELPAAVEPENVQVFLPQQTEGFPRSFFVVTEVPSGESAYPQLQYFIQASARENYRLVYQVNLFQDMPEVAAAATGGATVPDDSKLLPETKTNILETYAEILQKGDEADEDELFKKEGDLLREQFGKTYKDKRIKDMPKYSKLEFSNSAQIENIVGFWTADSGAILLGTIKETETVTPSEKGAKVSPTGNVKILFGKDKSSTGIVTTYLQQVLFYVPPITSDEQIQMIGYSQNLISAKEK